MENIREVIKVKVQKEYDDYIERLSKRDVKDVIDEAYTIVIRSEILSILLNSEIEERVLQRLKGLENIIDVLYYAWLKEDFTNNEDIKLVIYKYVGFELETKKEY